MDEGSGNKRKTKYRQSCLQMLLLRNLHLRARFEHNGIVYKTVTTHLPRPSSAILQPKKIRKSHNVSYLPSLSFKGI